MGANYIIGGVAVSRRSLIKLSAAERELLSQSGRVAVLREVEWPIPNRIAFFDQAHVDPGGTDIWGSGPYLKVPNVGPEVDSESVNRVFCPWGYPPERVRVSRTQIYLEILSVELLRNEDSKWCWALGLTDWSVSRSSRVGAGQ